LIPPILEIFILWHPEDTDGEVIAGQLVDHFHGTAFSGLIGGAIEIYMRSTGWLDSGDAPRPIPDSTNSPYGILDPAITAVIPVLGIHLAEAVQAGSGPWYDYVRGVVSLGEESPASVGVFPILLSDGPVDGTVLEAVFGSIQAIRAVGTNASKDTAPARCRDVAQGIAQLANGQERLNVFVSHTKRAGEGEGEAVDDLIARVRCVIMSTHLREYFDASDLQPGSDWPEKLVTNARQSALLAVRTDLYATREWCQREVAVAKRAGMPVVILDALSSGEERGSFLMDHVARIPNGAGVEDLRDAAIIAALNQLVDESLKRELWIRQQEITNSGALWDVAWWAPHAPEPLTLTAWLTSNIDELRDQGTVRLLHPDPPLGPVERDALDQIAALSGLGDRLDIVTPRGLAARGA
jgi:hypothetical protein